MPTTTRTVEIGAPPEKIWEVLSDGNRWPEWLTPIRGLEETAPAVLHEGDEFHVALGKMGGAKIKVTEVTTKRRLRWNAGPGMAHMMGMPMKASLELQLQGVNRTRVVLTMITPMMMAPMMGMMTGLKAKDEVERTVQ